MAPALAPPNSLDVMEAVWQLKESAKAQDARIKGLEKEVGRLTAIQKLDSVADEERR